MSLVAETNPAASVANGGTFVVCGPPKDCVCPAVAYRCQCEASRINYTGPDPSVECARQGCTNRLRKVDHPLFANDRQWCSRLHRDQDEFDERTTQPAGSNGAGEPRD